MVVLASSSFGPILSRNLLYTALTRARRAVVVVGDEAAIAEAVARTRDQERVTGLPVLLAGRGDRCRHRRPGTPTSARHKAPTSSPSPVRVERGAPQTCLGSPSPSQWGGGWGVGASPCTIEPS